MSVGERSVTEASGSVNRMGENFSPCRFIKLKQSNSSVSRFMCAVCFKYACFVACGRCVS